MIDLVLSPRDGLFLKDGREWAIAATGHAHSLDWPMPSTLLGALRTACGRAEEADRRKPHRDREWRELADGTALGASLPLRRPLHEPLHETQWNVQWNAADRVWPVPADALFLTDRIVRLDPVKLPHSAVGRDNNPAREALWWPLVGQTGKPQRAPTRWGDSANTEWLIQRDTERPKCPAFAGLDLPRHIRTHVTIAAETAAAADGALFAHDVFETLEAVQSGAVHDRFEWGMLCRLTGKRAAAPKHVTIGGDRRLAHVYPLKPANTLFDMPPKLGRAFNNNTLGLRLLVVTPCAFAGGWLPDGFAPSTPGGDEFHGLLPGVSGRVILRAAMIPRATHVSGWDMAKGEPKSTTRLVPPGATYHFVKQNAQAFTAAEAAKLWLTSLGGRTKEGFGCVVPGVWDPKGTPK